MYNNSFRSESNTAPSQLNTSPSNTGVVSQLANQLAKQPSFDNVSIDDMRGNPLYAHVDDIDKVGLVQRSIIETSKTIKSNMKRIRAFNDAAAKVRIPNKSQKK